MLQEVQEAKGPNRWHAAEGSEMSKSVGADQMIMNMQGSDHFDGKGQPIQDSHATESDF